MPDGEKAYTDEEVRERIQTLLKRGDKDKAEALSKKTGVSLEPAEEGSSFVPPEARDFDADDEPEQHAPPGKSEEAVSAPLAFGLGALRAASRELSDEAGGAGAAAAAAKDRLQNMSPDEVMEALTAGDPEVQRSYRAERGRWRELQERAERQRPGATMAGMVPAAIATTPPIGPQLGTMLAGPFAQANFITRALTAVGNLAPAGAASGAGMAVGAAEEAEDIPREMAEGAGEGAAIGTLFGVGGETLMAPLRAVGRKVWQGIIKPSVAGPDEARVANMITQAGGEPVLIGRQSARTPFTKLVTGEATTFDDTMKLLDEVVHGNKDIISDADSVVHGLRLPSSVQKVQDEWAAQASKAGGNANILDYIARRINKKVADAVDRQHTATLNYLGNKKKAYLSSAQAKSARIDVSDVYELAQAEMEKRFKSSVDNTATNKAALEEARSMLADLRGPKGSRKVVDPEGLISLIDSFADKAKASTDKYQKGAIGFAGSVHQALRKKVKDTPELKGLKEYYTEAEETLDHLNGYLRTMGITAPTESVKGLENRLRIGQVIAGYMTRGDEKEALDYFLTHAGQEAKMVREAAALRDWLMMARESGAKVHGVISPYGGTTYVSPGRWRARAAGLKNVRPGSLPGRTLTGSAAKVDEAMGLFDVLDALLGEEEKSDESDAGR